MVLDLPEPIAIACHDAGAANIILAWIAHEAKAVRPVMGGPAAGLWAARFPETAPLGNTGEAIAASASLLSGTGWMSKLEHRARAEAREAGIRSIAVIDHWINYRERFVREGEIVLPDEIWVTDWEAVKIAKATFPHLPVALKPNLYQQSVAARARSLAAEADRLLYVLEPMQSNWGRETPGEFQALDYLAGNLDAAGMGHDTKICLRPHPSDPVGKYDGWIEQTRRRGLEVRLDDIADLGEAIGRASAVAGCQSAALAIALCAGRRVISTLPPWAPPCVLPHEGILHLGLIVGNIR